MTTVARRLAPALVALATAACALTNTGPPSTAAVIGDERIPTSQVDGYYDAIRGGDSFRAQAQQEGSSGIGAQAQTDVMTALVRSIILEDVAQRNDVQVSDAEVQAAVDGIVQRLGGQEAFEEALVQEGVPRELFLRQVRDQQVQAALQEHIGAGAEDDPERFIDFLRDETADVPIEINPRYGAWDATNMAVTPADPLAPDGAPTPPAQ